MKKILNTMFYVLQFLLFLLAFAGTLFIMLQMARRLNKNFMENFNVFIPFILLFVILIINIFANQKNVKGNLFYNLTSNLVFTTIIVVALRAMFDRNLIIGNITSYKIDFTYFANFLPFLKIMLYGLCLSNFFLMFHVKDTKKNKEQIEEL